MPAGMAFSVQASLGCFPADKLVKIAELAASGFFLIEQRQARLIEFLEEFVPRNGDEALVASIGGVWEFNAQNPGVGSQ